MLVCVIVSQTGCAVWQQARTTLISEPSAYSWKWDRKRSLKAYRRWADEAWLAERGGCPHVAGDADYALGFRDGFVDYIYAGGNGEPPPTPPRQYWNVWMRGADGKAAASQWFAGYRHGASVARAGGYRESGIVASSYAWGGAVIGGYVPRPTMGEYLGPGRELLPEPAGDAIDAVDPLTESTPILPRVTLPPTATVGAEPKVDEEPSARRAPRVATDIDLQPPAFEAPAGAAPATSEAARGRPLSAGPTPAKPPAAAPALIEPSVAAPPTAEPDASPESIFDLGPPTTGPAPRAPQSPARAIERFRRAVSTVQFEEPRATK